MIERVRQPSISYRDLNLLADAGRYGDLIEFARDRRHPPRERLEVAPVIAVEGPAALAAAAAGLFPDDGHGFLGPLWEVAAQRPGRSGCGVSPGSRPSRPCSTSTWRSRIRTRASPGS